MSDVRTLVEGGLIDQYEAPLFIAWQINSECNLDCLHCCEEAGVSFPDEMNLEEKLDLCRQAVELKVPYVAISGGEPMMCPHLWDVCEYLRKHNVSVKIETNGEAIDERIADRLAKLNLRSVQVSLDGADAYAHESLRKAGDWRAVVDACERLIERNVNLEIVFVPTRFNIDQIGEVADLAAGVGAGGFYTGKIMRIGRAAKNWTQLNPTEEQYENFFKVLEERREKYGGRMKIYFYPFDVIEELRYRMENPAASLLVLPNGKAKMIGPLPFICGDLKKTPLVDVWKSYKGAWNMPEVQEFAGRLFNDSALLAESNNWIEL